MVALLITLLTSNNLAALKLSYASVINQKKTTIHYTIIIVINTICEEYGARVKKEFPNVEIAESFSNGKPGKGHNSVLAIFKQYGSKYDYLLPLDGDDFLYPYAVHRLETYITYNPDVLFLPYSDILTTHFNGPALHCPISGKCYLYFNNYLKDHHKTWLKDKISPFIHNINQTNTPGRLILCSQKALNMGLSYNEDLYCYDDFNLFLQVFDVFSTQAAYSIFMIDDKDILLYNKINSNSVTKKFTINASVKQLEEEQVFRQSIFNRFLAIRNWDLATLIFLETDAYPYFTVVDKKEFCQNLAMALKLPTIAMNTDYVALFKKYAVENDFIRLQAMYE